MLKRPLALHIKHDALAVCAGLAVAQAVASIAVRQSNLRIFRETVDMQDAGWFAVPTGPALDLLPTFGAAFAGAFFFTLTSGTVLSLAGWAMVRLWRMYLPRGRYWYAWPAAAAALGIAYANSKGWVWFPTLLTAAVLPTSGLIAGLSPAPARMHSQIWIPLIVLALLTGIWTTQLNRGLFTTIRDHLLLSNAAGSKVNDFYYRNTLYAAELFKSLDQKSLRTFRLEGRLDPPAIRRLNSVMAGHDMLALPGDTPVDLTIRLTPAADGSDADPPGQSVALISRKGRRINTSLAAVIADPQKWISRVSEQDDRYAPFRRLTFLGLLIGFPVLLYWAVYSLIRRSLGFFIRGRFNSWSASGICLAVGILLFIPVFSGRAAGVAPENINTVLQSGPWTRRVAALQTIEKRNLEIVDYPSYRNLLQGSTVVERYYLARVLALSRAPGSYNDLSAMIDDAHPNVVCQVFYALGRRGRMSAVEPIKNRIMQSDHWYIQWYGYRALRNLGWEQRQSVSPH